MSMSPFDAASGQDDREDLGIMIAPGGAVDLGRAAEFRGHHHQSGIEQAALIEIADERRQRLIELGHLAGHGVLDIVVMIPASVGERNEADTSFHEAPGQKHPLAGRSGTVVVADFLRLVAQRERGAGLVGREHGVGAMIEGVHPVEGIGFLQCAEVRVDRRPHFPPGGKPVFVHAVGKVQVAHLEIVVGRIVAQAEGAIGGAEIARAGKRIGLAGNADIRRQIVPRTQFMGNDAAETGILQGGAGPVTREHVVSPAIMIGLTVRHRAHHRDLVGDLGRLDHDLREVDAVEPCFHRVEGTAVFDGGVQLGIEGFLGGHPARQINLDDGLRDGFWCRAG
jgi:hypothetical protein